MAVPHKLSITRLRLGPAAALLQRHAALVFGVLLLAVALAFVPIYEARYAEDAPPLNGYGDAGYTTTWQIGDPVHDERSIPLPSSLPPGRYTLLLGVYPASDPAEGSRLPVAGTIRPVLGGTRLVLGEVVISPLIRTLRQGSL